MAHTIRTDSAPRIAVGSILTECNELGGLPIDLDWFARYDLHYGEDLLQLNAGVVGGALQILRERAATVAPLLSASTCPGGSITTDCYGTLKTELLQRLQQSLPSVNGVLLLLHGSAVADGVGDVEGDLISAVRQLVGPQLPIVVTLDCHAHVTEVMARDADALLAWETYPHADSYTTGQRGARLLIDTVEGRCRPTMAVAKVPVLTSGINGTTAGDGPFARIMQLAKSHEGKDGILSTSAILVHPYLDQPGMGSGAIVVSDDNLQQAVSLAEEIARTYWDNRRDFECDVHTPEDAIAAGLVIEDGPVLLIETADCAGGGASGDSVASLKALLQLGDPPSAIVPVVDPAAAAACHEAGVGARLHFTLGHQLDPKWGQPVEVEGVVQTLSDGQFRYVGGIWDNVEGDMGTSAVFAIGAIQVLITTHATYDWADEQIRSVGLDPARAKFVVVKNPMNYHNAYDAIAKQAFVLDTPGPTPATLRHNPFARVTRPFFPCDEEIPGLEPTVYAFTPSDRC